jgi:hypothetical protein
MSATSTVIRGFVRGGVVVFDPPTVLPEGTEVQVTIPIVPFTPEEKAEFEEWDKLSDEAFKMITDLERQERDGSG